MKPCSLKSVPSFHTGMCVEAEGEKMGVLVEEGWKVSGRRGSFAWECLLEEL